MSVFEKWNRNVNQSFLEEVENAETGKGGFEEVPVGTYEVKLAKAGIRSTKNGDPMLSISFKILRGDCKGRLIFMNQVINQPFQIHIANDFLRSLDSGVEIVFRNYEQYNEIVLDVQEAVEAQKLEYALEYGKNEKGFSTYEITDVFGE